jgi:hypothetical protein
MSERTFISAANELESNGLKLLVKVTPVLFSNVKVELAPEAAVRPALMTMPSVKHDIAVKTTAALLNIFLLYTDSVQPAFADVLFESCWSLLNKREAGWTFAILPTARTS